MELRHDLARMGLVRSAGFWSHFWFWVGIVCLFAVGASATISHIYGMRKNELMAAKMASLAATHKAEVQSKIEQGSPSVTEPYKPEPLKYLRLNNSKLLSRPLAPLLAKRSEWMPLWGATMRSRTILLTYFVLPNGALIPQARRALSLQQGFLVFSQR